MTRRLCGKCGIITNGTAWCWSCSATEDESDKAKRDGDRAWRAFADVLMATTLVLWGLDNAEWVSHKDASGQWFEAGQ